MSQQYRCQDESGQISYHAVPCAEVRITVKTPGKVEIDSAALELYMPWIIGLLIFSVCCLAAAKILKNILESREKKGNWKSAVKGNPVQSRHLLNIEGKAEAKNDSNSSH